MRVVAGGAPPRRASGVAVAPFCARPVACLCAVSCCVLRLVNRGETPVAGCGARCRESRPRIVRVAVAVCARALRSCLVGVPCRRGRANKGGEGMGWHVLCLPPISDPLYAPHHTTQIQGVTRPSGSLAHGGRARGTRRARPFAWLASPAKSPVVRHSEQRTESSERESYG